MTEIEHYLNDGANWQAQAVLAAVRGNIYDLLSDTYDNDYYYRYHAKVEVGRYENCREQGYVFTLYYDDRQVKHYAVYEHRNSDQICILCQTGISMNTPNASFMFGPDRGKYDVDKSFSSGQIMEAANWIIDDMKESIRPKVEKLIETKLKEG